MNIVGFNFTQISALRNKSVVGKVNIKNNILLSDVKEAKIGIGKDRTALRISFAYKSEYEPGIAKMEMAGDVMALEENKKAKEILKTWEKEKKLDSEVAKRVVNHVLDKCSIQSLLLAKDLNLPSPVQLPRVATQTAAKEEDKPKK